MVVFELDVDVGMVLLLLLLLPTSRLGIAKDVATELDARPVDVLSVDSVRDVPYVEEEVETVCGMELGLVSDVLGVAVAVTVRAVVVEKEVRTRCVAATAFGSSEQTP